MLTKSLGNNSKARKLEAEITLEYDNAEYAEAVAKSVSPDNFKAPSGLSVETVCMRKEVFTSIKCKVGIPTFIATIDDLLFCVSISEKVLSTTSKLESRS